MPKLSAELLRRLRNRADRDAWEQFYKQMSPRVTWYLVNQGLDLAQAEDIRQEVFVTFYQQLLRVATPAHAENFLFQLTNRRLTDSRRRTRPLVDIDEVADELQAEEDLDPLDRDTMRSQIVQQAILQLDAGQQRLLELHLEGKSRREIAADLSISEVNVGVKLLRLKKRLREASNRTPSRPTPKTGRKKK